MHPHPDSVPFPTFRQPPGLDEPLPTIPADPDKSSSSETASSDHLPEDPRAEPRPEPLPPTPATPAAVRTRTSSPGDPKAAARLVRGLIAILAGTAAALLARRQQHLRQPTAEQVADIADPLGAILARHLPAEAITGDLIDITSAAAAGHAYVLDGPIVERIPTVNTEETL